MTPTERIERAEEELRLAKAELAESNGPKAKIRKIFGFYQNIVINDFSRGYILHFTPQSSNSFDCQDSCRKIVEKLKLYIGSVSFADNTVTIYLYHL